MISGPAIRTRLGQAARIWAIASLVAWITLLAAALGSTANVHAAVAGEGTESAPASTKQQLEQRRATPQTSIDEVSATVMCPTCDSTLDQSDSPAAESMRVWIENAVEAGWTKQEIRDGLVAEYDGDESILAVPRAKGLGLGVWIVPAIVVGGALLVGALSLRRWRRASDARR
jgi:cytochrome c-type biogenesis protein CcmH/NrfF